MVVEIRRRMDVKNGWELKWIGASSLDPSLIASSENAQYILSSSSHCAENSALDTSPRPVHSPACCWASIAAQKHTEKAHVPQNTHHSALAQIALDSEMNCWHLESRLLLLYTLLLSSAASGPFSALLLFFWSKLYYFGNLVVYNNAAMPSILSDNNNQ